MIEGNVLMRIWNEKIVTPTGCWDHPHQPNTDMPTLNAGRGTTITVRHAMYRYLKGSIPKDARILTTCKNNRCFNPDHLVLSTEHDEPRTPKPNHSILDAPDYKFNVLVRAKEKVISYWRQHPKATAPEVAEACNCSIATAYKWRSAAAVAQTENRT